MSQRPTLLVCACLGFEPVRYDGSVVDAPFVRRLVPYVRLVTVCPEVGMGLPVPRPPVVLVRGEGGPRLVEPQSGVDLTQRLLGYTEGFLAGLPPLDGAVLKARSPSCGAGDAKLFKAPGDDEPAGAATGLFAATLCECLPGLPVATEELLDKPARRRKFLEAVYARAGAPVPSALR